MSAFCTIRNATLPSIFTGVNPWVPFSTDDFATDRPVGSRHENYRIIMVNRQFGSKPMEGSALSVQPVTECGDSTCVSSCTGTAAL